MYSQAPMRDLPEELRGERCCRACQGKVIDG